MFQPQKVPRKKTGERPSSRFFSVFSPVTVFVLTCTMLVRVFSVFSPLRSLCLHGVRVPCLSVFSRYFLLIFSVTCLEDSSPCCHCHLPLSFAPVCFHSFLFFSSRIKFFSAVLKSDSIAASQSIRALLIVTRVTAPLLVLRLSDLSLTPFRNFRILIRTLRVC
jgi:hypothetical protein